MIIKDAHTPQGRDMGPGRVRRVKLSHDDPLPGSYMGDGREVMRPPERCPLCGRVASYKGGCITTLSSSNWRDKNASLKAARIRQGSALQKSLYFYGYD